MVQAGFIIAVGLLLDTFLVRTITVPAMAVLVGRANWWPSRSGPRRKPPARRLREQEQSERVRNPSWNPSDQSGRKVAATGQTHRQNSDRNADVLRHLSLWVTARPSALSRYQRGPELLGKLHVQRIHETLGVTSRPCTFNEVLQLVPCERRPQQGAEEFRHVAVGQLSARLSRPSAETTSASKCAGT
jgi:hypothetical protein